MIKQVNEQEIFAVNPDCKVSSGMLGEYKCVIVDDFYLNPEKVRELALCIPATKNILRNTYPGLSINVSLDLSSLTDTFISLIHDHFSDTPCKPDKDIHESFKYMSFLVNVMQGQPQPMPHTDSPYPDCFAATVFLNYNEESHGGTAFYSSEGVQLGYAEMQFNRLVLYKQTAIHAAVMEPDWFTGNDYRINQMFFI
jgi:hypothetical protein